MQGRYLAKCTPPLFSAIRELVQIEVGDSTSLEELEEARVQFSESKRLARERHFFSRNSALGRAAKEKYGSRCQVCGFSFEDRYGALGRGYIECHHLNPLSERSDSETVTILTSLEEVRVLCANCHRMIHRRRPALSVEELREVFTSRGST